MGLLPVLSTFTLGGGFSRDPLQVRGWGQARAMHSTRPRQQPQSRRNLGFLADCTCWALSKAPPTHSPTNPHSSYAAAARRPPLPLAASDCPHGRCRLTQVDVRPASGTGNIPASGAVPVVFYNGRGGAGRGGVGRGGAGWTGRSGAGRRGMGLSGMAPAPPAVRDTLPTRPHDPRPPAPTPAPMPAHTPAPVAVRRSLR